MSEPTIGSFAQEVYDRLAPLVETDEDQNWATKTLVGGVGLPFQEVADIVQDLDSGIRNQIKSIKPKIVSTALKTPAGTTIVIDKPISAIEGDFLLAFIFEGSGSGTPAITPPAGWTAIGSLANVSNSGFQTYYKIAGGSEPANYTWTYHVSTLGAGVIIPLENVDPDDPIAAFVSTVQAGGFDPLIPSVEVTRGQLVLAGGATKNGTTFTSPATMTELIDIKTGTGDGDRSLTVATQWIDEDQVLPQRKFIDDGQHDTTDVLSKVVVLNPVIEEVETDEAPGWSEVVNVDAAPAKFLPWLGQFIGVRGLPGSFADAEQRDRIKAADGFNRGTPASIITAAKAFLTGNKTVILRERYPSSAYELEVVTFTSETPSEDNVLASILTQKPAGIVLTYNVYDGQDFQSLKDGYTDFQDVKDTYATFDDVRLDIP